MKTITAVVSDALYEEIRRFALLESTFDKAVIKLLKRGLEAKM